MENTHIFKPEHVPENEAVLGVYDGQEWIYADFLRRRHMAGKQTLELSSTWLIKPGFTLSKWVCEMGFKSYTFYNTELVVVAFNDGYLRVSSSKGKIDVNVAGEPSFCDAWEQHFASSFKKAENLIRWVYNVRGDDISVPLNYRKGINAAYPWIRGKTLNEYINAYLASEACVLILIGPPGTGKTTFIKNLIHQSGGDAMVTYDQKVLETDDFFAEFIDSQTDILVMEDADNFLESRKDGNTMMHKFLNVSDGLISTIGKKVIFSTNLPNITDIDDALLRTGRCFDVLQFRPLTRSEAKATLAEIGDTRELGDGSEFTLAEVFTEQLHADNVSRNNIGFV